MSSYSLIVLSLLLKPLRRAIIQPFELPNGSEKVTTLCEVGSSLIVLRGSWVLNEYTITFKLNGGKYYDGTTTYKLKYTILDHVYLPTFIIAPTDLPGWKYVFTGWLDEKTGERFYHELPAGSTGNRTLVAQYEQTF